MAQLPIEGEFPELEGATAWLNSEPLTPAGLRGKVVVVQFCTFSCVNWLRTLPYVRAWEKKYRDAGLVVIGAHSPDFAIWRAFENQAWPALYFIDAQGRIRHRHFGEEDYERSEQVIQQLLAEAGVGGVETDLVSAEPGGVELAANWDTLQSPETYVGYGRATGLVSPGGVDPDRSKLYMDPPQLRLNQWSLSGDWTVGEQITTLNEPGGRITCRFHARDVNLVMGTRTDGGTARYLVLFDGEPPNGNRGIDVDQRGSGTIAAPRLYQLVRQSGAIAERTFEITFLDAGAQAYVFTFG